MATTAQIQLALQRARAAGNAQDVAALQQALTQSQQETGAPQSAQTTTRGPWDNYAPTRRYVVTSPEGKQYEVTAPASASQADVMAYAQRQAAHLEQPGPWNNYAKPTPTREQVSTAFYRARAAGDEGAARQLVGYLQQHGMTLTPMNAGQIQAMDQQAAANTTAEMNPLERLWNGIGEGANSFNAGLREHIVDPIRDAIDGGNRTAADAALVAQDRELSQPLNATPSGQIGNLVGATAASAPMALIPGGGETLPARVAGAALAGGGFGYVAPSASEREHLSNTVIGAALAPVAVGAGKAAQLVGRGGRSIVQRYVAPDAVAQGRIARILAGEGATPGQLRAYADPVPGVRPTLAQILQTPRAVQLERAARNNPISGPELAALDLQNNAARTSALQQHVLPAAELAAARGSRAANFAPIGDALRDAGSIDVGPLRFEAANLARRGNNAMTRVAAKKVLSFIDDNTAQTGADAGTIPIADLHTLQHDLGTIVKQANPEAVNTSQALRELQPFKSAIVDTVDSIVPGYRSALERYAKDSAPIRTSQAIADILDPTRATANDLTGEPTLTASNLRSMLAKDDRAPFKLSPQARQDVERVQASIQSKNAAQRSIGPSGSPTEENRQAQLMRRGAGLLAHGGAGAAAGSFLGPVGSIAGLLGGVGFDALDRAAQNRIAGAIGKLVADPQASSRALEDYLELQARRRAVNAQIAPTDLGRNWTGYASGLVPEVTSANRRPQPSPIAAALGVY